MQKLRALVVDDSRILRKMVMDGLSKTNLAEFEFVEAEDGVDALARFEGGGIDIAFVDWNMPKMSGVEFAAKVRAGKTNRSCPIIMVTSEKTVGKMELAMDKAGANGYICKPFTVEEMQRKIGRIVGAIEPGGPPAEPEKKGGFFSKLAQGMK